MGAGDDSIDAWLRNFPGMSGSAPNIPGADPALPSDLVGPYAAQKASEQITSAQRSALFSGKIEASVVGFIEKALNGAAEKVLNTMDRTPTGHQIVTQIHAAVTNPGAAPSAPIAPAPVAPSAPPAPSAQPRSIPHLPNAGVQPVQPPSQDPAPTVADRFREGRQMAQQATMGSVARSVAAPAARWMNERGAGWEQVTDDLGRQAFRYRDSATGAVLDQVPEDDPEYARIARNLALGSHLTKFAAGQGIAGSMGSLGAVATRVAGPIGIAVGGVAAAGNWLEDQNQAASQYRSYFGQEGTGFFAARERMDNWIAGLQGFGTIGGERARAQFQAASAMGLRGSRREDATDFASTMWSKYGLETDESMELVERSVKTGTVSLKTFEEAIAGVSKAAVEAGRTSKEAIKEFVDAQDYVSKNLVAGDASVAVTEQMTAIANRLDPALRESLGGAEGVAGLLNQNNVMQVAAMSGQNANAAWWRMQNPETAEAQATATINGLAEQVVAIMARAMDRSPEQLKADVGRATGGKPVSQNEQFRIFQELAGGEEVAAGVLMQVLQIVTSQFGVRVDAAQVLNFLFSSIQGQFSAPDQISFMGVEGMGFMDFTKNLLSISGRSQSPGGPFGISVDHSAIPGSIRSGLSDYRGSGQTNAAIEALMDPSNYEMITQKAGVDSIEDVRYRVVDKSGKAVDLPLDKIAANDDYRRQMLVGSAGIVGPHGNPTPVSDVTKVQVEFTGEAADWIRQLTGPTESQQFGLPESGYRDPGTYPRYGGGY